MSEIIIPWGPITKRYKNEQDRIVKEIEEKSQKSNAFYVSLDISLLEWLEESIGNGVVKRAYTGGGDKIDVIIGVDEPSAQMLADRTR
jgi:hypothetical protein